jgi:hypothetical protein
MLFCLSENIPFHKLIKNQNFRSWKFIFFKTVFSRFFLSGYRKLIFLQSMQNYEFLCLQSRKKFQLLFIKFWVILAPFDLNSEKSEKSLNSIKNCMIILNPPKSTHPTELVSASALIVAHHPGTFSTFFCFNLQSVDVHTRVHYNTVHTVCRYCVQSTTKANSAFKKQGMTRFN